MARLNSFKTSKINKMYKKYIDGGGIDEEQRATNINNGIGAATTTTALIAPAVGKHNSVAGSTLTGAAAGASVGMAFGPYGAAAGAVIGGTAGFVKGKQNEKQQQEAQQQYKDALNKQSIDLATQRGLQTKSINSYSLTERKMGGKLSKLSDNTVIAKGATHEQGGIKLPSLGAEVEGGETLKKMNDGGTFVMSDSIVNPKTGNTFAKDDMKLSKQKGKLEQLQDSRFTRKGLSLLKNRENRLMQMQEELKEASGMDNNVEENLEVAKYGGQLKKMSKGGIDPITGNPYNDSEFNFINDQPETRGVFKPDYTGIGNPSKTSTRSLYDTQQFLRGKGYVNKFGKNTGQLIADDGMDGVNTQGAISRYKASNPFKYKALSSDSGFQEPVIKGIERDNVDNTSLIEPKDKTGRNWGSKLASLSPYIDNVTGALFTNQRSKEKLPNLQTTSYMNPNHVDYSQALKDTRDSVKAYNQGVDTTNTNQANANIMKAFGLGERMKGIARISQEENNANNTIDNDFLVRNKEIEIGNNQINFNNAERNRIGRDDIRREYQQNIVDVNKKFQEQRRDKNQETDDNYLESSFEDGTRKYFSRKRNGGKLSKLKISY